MDTSTLTVEDRYEAGYRFSSSIYYAYLHKWIFTTKEQ